jgi:hypothetical protein
MTAAVATAVNGKILFRLKNGGKNVDAVYVERS